MLLNIQAFKIKNNSKHFKSSRMAPKHANAKWQIMQRFIHCLDIYSGEKTRIYSERPHLASGYFIKVFYKMTTCPRQPLLSGLKSGSLIQV